MADTGDPAHFFVNSQNSLSLTASIVLERSDKKQYDYDSHITMFERMTKKSDLSVRDKSQSYSLQLRNLTRTYLPLGK